MHPNSSIAIHWWHVQRCANINIDEWVRRLWIRMYECHREGHSLRTSANWRWDHFRTGATQTNRFAHTFPHAVPGPVSCYNVYWAMLVVHWSSWTDPRHWTVSCPRWSIDFWCRPVKYRNSAVDRVRWRLEQWPNQHAKSPVLESTMRQIVIHWNLMHVTQNFRIKRLRRQPLLNVLFLDPHRTEQPSHQCIPTSISHCPDWRHGSTLAFVMGWTSRRPFEFSTWLCRTRRFQLWHRPTILQSNLVLKK